MAKKQNTAPVSVLSLDDIAGLTAAQAADSCGERYQTRSRIFVEMGKLVFHIETRTGLPKGEKSIYSMLQKRKMPEGSVHNARLAANFIATFVATGLVTESRADEIITHRVVNQCSRILSGKSAATMTAEELAPLLNSGHKAAIGDELDCIDEHGMTIAAHKEAEEKKRAEMERIAAAAEAAAKLPPAPVETPAAPAATTEPETIVVDGTKTETPAAESTAPAAETPAAPQANITPISTPPASQSSHESRPANTADVLAKISEVELQSYDLDPAGLQAVRDKLASWMDLIDSSLEVAKKPEKAKVA